MNKDLILIFDKLKSKIYFDYDIGKLTWFRTGGKAEIFIIVDNISELEIIMNAIKNRTYFILGYGSNLLVRDSGFKGVVLKLGSGFNNVRIKEDCVEVGAGTLDINLSKFALNNQLQGFEFYSGIPGTIGGAVKMNAGCFGSETKDILTGIEVIDDYYNKKYLNNCELKLKYRSSNIKNNYIITKVFYNYKKGNIDEITEKIQNIKDKRNATQPIKNKTSGSTFKNPNNMFAAKLIQDSDCKGLAVGDALISSLHANFIINKGKATATDIENLGNLVKNRVYKKFNILLDWEIKIIGEKN